MRRLLLLLTVSLLAATIWAQEGEVKVNPAGKVTVGSKGKDVRDVLYDLFSQSKKSFVLDQSVRYSLYLNLFEVDFDDALDIVVNAAGLGYEVQGNIYYIGRDKPKPRKTSGKADPKPETKTDTTTDPKAVEGGGSAKTDSPDESPTSAPKGKLSYAEMQKRLTTRLSMTDIRVVFGEFSRQTGIKVIVSDSVPRYKVDAFLINTSLKFAMDTITKAAGLKYTLTENKELMVENLKKGSGV